MDNLTEAVDYFENTIAANHAEINAFIYGDFGRLLNYMSSNPSGTTLFMEWPEANPEDNEGSYTIKYEVSLYLLTVVDPDQWQQQNTAMSNMLKIITADMFPRIRQDMFDRADIFSINDSRNIEPVTFLTMDSLFGYKFTIQTGTWLPVDADNETVWIDRT